MYGLLCLVCFPRQHDSWGVYDVYYQSDWGMIMANTGTGNMAPISETFANLMEKSADLKNRVIRVDEILEVKGLMYQVEQITTEQLVLRPLPDEFKLT